MTTEKQAILEDLVKRYNSDYDDWTEMVEAIVDDLNNILYKKYGDIKKRVADTRDIRIALKDINTMLK